MMQRIITPALMLAFAIIGCSNGSTDATPKPSKVEVVSGSGGSATVGATVTLTAKVTDGSGAPMPNIIVHFAVSGGGGNVTPSVDTSDANGLVTATLTLGNATGTNTVTATADGVSTPATFTVTGTAVTSQTLSVGGVLNFDNGTAIVRPASSGEQYAVVAHYYTATTTVGATLDVTGSAIVAPSSSFPSLAPSNASIVADAMAQKDENFEMHLRQREKALVGPHVAGARAWFDGRQAPQARSANFSMVPANPGIGDVFSFNVNSNDFCSKPVVKGFRVTAVSSTAIVLADTLNPSPTFTNAEYNDFALAMDTLVNPVDTGAFGKPSDIDNNNKVLILFTRAVNELTPQGSPSGVVLGFYYIRDLLPLVDPVAGNCPGSNVAEMFYMLAPDPGGAVNSNVRTKAFVQSVTVGTIAHEYQHLINASRRMYVTKAPKVDEDVWLNEGLSHIAEELIFYKSSGLSSRTNLGTSLATGTTRANFDLYQRNNFGRYRRFLLLPETNSPLAGNDNLETRGATWSFLRYLADRRASTDGTFWSQLVNSQSTGITNLDGVLSSSSLTTATGLRDWAVSVIADDNPSSTNAIYQQPSWNFITGMPATGVSASFPLFTRSLQNGSKTTVTLALGGTSYLRFSGTANTDATISVANTSGGSIPNGVKLHIVRMK